MLLLTVTQAAKQSGVHRRKLLRAIAAGELKAQKTGGGTAVWIIRPIDLERWLKRQND